MKSAITSILAACLALAALGVLPLAEAQEPTSARAVNFVAPQVWAASRSVERGARAVTVKSVDARIDILEGVATTELLIRLANATGRPQEASLLLSVPKGATVRAFDFQGTASEPTAELLPAGEAKATYNGIVSKLRDPALLEFVGFSLIRSSVFPVPASGEQAVKVTYEHILPAAGGRLEYVGGTPAELGMESTYNVVFGKPEVVEWVLARIGQH